MSCAVVISCGLLHAILMFACMRCVFGPQVSKMNGHISVCAQNKCFGPVCAVYDCASRLGTGESRDRTAMFAGAILYVVCALCRRIKLHI